MNALAPLLASCVLAQAASLTTPAHAQTTVTYAASALDFPNPERGFYRYSETRSSNYTPLVQAELEAYRSTATAPPSAGYAVYSTLVFRYFFLEDFKAADISTAYLAAVQTDFDVARAAGVKLIPRFAYTDAVDGSGCASFICPPYGDAAKAWVLRHIQQLAPVLQANADVTAAVQMGFIGTWGEQYYTDHFGDASQGPDFKLTDANWADRNEVLGALLDAVPETRQVQVRYPQLKQRYVYGVQAPTSSGALTAGEAYAKTDKARIGLHNDCLLASADDFGTFTDYGNDATASQSDTATLKPYAAAEGAFVAVGGETCSDGYSPQNDCAGTDPLARADRELRRLGYAYLNSQYNNDVNDDWVGGGCMDAIKRELGYRLELRSGTYTDAVAPGQTVALALEVANVGYAAPFNPRGARLVLRSRADGETYAADLDADPRRWGPDVAAAITQDLCVPADVPPGDYDLLLHLPDPMSSLAERPAYAIRAASLLPGGADVWEASTGYNRLGHTVTIAAGATRPACGAETAFAKTSTAVPVTLARFVARPTDGHVTLSWATATERGNVGFAVERSRDGVVYDEIAFVPAHADGAAGAEYAYRDADVRPGHTYYYRLRQRDADGTETLSRVVTATVPARANAPRLFPNPTTGVVQVAWPGTSQEEVSYLVSDALGRVLESGPGGAIDLSPLPSGVYAVTLRAGGRTYVLRAIRR